MDNIAPALAPAGLSPSALGGSLSGIGTSGLAGACTGLLFLYLTARFIWMYNKEATTSATAAAASSPPVVQPCFAVPLLLLPVFVHMASLGAAERAAECVVCLSGFREREVGWHLPGCGYGFHEECIATWLRFNPTCPLCRALVAAQ